MTTNLLVKGKERLLETGQNQPFIEHLETL
jgi:hypothetical protein